MVIEINLTPGDVAFAATEATARFNYNRAKGNDASRGAAPTWVEQVAREISGCLGEIAIARWQDKFPFSLFSERKMGDVGEFEVRTTAYSSGKLLIDPTDDPQRKYLLVTLPSHYRANICGWMYGYEAQEEKYFDQKMRMPCYAVPQQFLHDPRSVNG